MLGILQLCVVGVIARGSFGYRRYVNSGAMGRISLALIYAILMDVKGLISLAVEISHETQVLCNNNDNGESFGSGPLAFPYGNAACGLVCLLERSPFSPIRAGVTGNIHVAPRRND